MNLTRQNTDLQQVQHVLRSILTEIETRKVSGEPVARVATTAKHGKSTEKDLPVMTTNELHREVQEWRNRALLAESQLAIATSRPRAHKLPLTNAAGDMKPALEATTVESD